MLLITYMYLFSSSLFPPRTIWIMMCREKRGSQGFIVENNPETEGAGQGRAVVFNDKSHDYCAVTILYPT